MIRSFANRDTERLYRRERVNRFRSFERIALRELRMLAAATVVHDLKHLRAIGLKSSRAIERGNGACLG
jgi:plasmid maintenance system killer protein